MTKKEQLEHFENLLGFKITDKKKLIDFDTLEKDKTRLKKTKKFILHFLNDNGIDATFQTKETTKIITNCRYPTLVNAYVSLALFITGVATFGWNEEGMLLNIQIVSNINNMFNELNSLTLEDLNEENISNIINKYNI